MKSFLFGMMMFVSGAVVLPVVMHRLNNYITARRSEAQLAEWERGSLEVGDRVVYCDSQGDADGDGRVLAIAQGRKFVKVGEDGDARYSRWHPIGRITRVEDCPPP